MKIYYNERHVKNVPKKYSEIENICNYFDDLDHKRLSCSERTSLSRVLNAGELQIQLAIFKSSLLYDSSVIYDLVAGKQPIGVINVITRNGRYLMLDFGDQIKLRCHELFWNIIENKSTIKRLY